MSHPFKHLKVIFKHRHQVIRNAAHCGIFFHALRHDLSKYSFPEFHRSSKFYVGTSSPVYEERKSNGNFSFICQHHTKRNPHHWEYWTDFFRGDIIVCALPYKWAVEYVCDMLAASKTYNPKAFSGETALRYFEARCDHYYIHEASKEFIKWALGRYATLGWGGLRKKDTKAKYEEIHSKYPQTQTIRGPKHID